ncbi:acyltransferase family protein [Paraburkholderia tropica]|uniref:acyltransferase family protein n=1 Tax=Paraburkholderia tropica TaxID=92647 RepID=UPI002AB0AAF8|nr:acyltransferase [Paraburkholderia tropica]
MTNAPQHKLANLEILRFLCSVSVLLFHYHVFAYVGGQPDNIPHDQLPFYSAVGAFYDRGFFAVQYFWCISGFIFFWRYQQSLKEGLDAREFFVLRFTRLYPLHIVTLLYIATVQLGYHSMTGSFFTYVENTPFHFLQHLLMLGNIQQPYHTSFNGVTWSVSVEVFAYISFFVICKYIKQSGCAALVVALACSIAFVEFWPNNKFLQCFALFFFGGCACIVHRWLVKYRLTLVAAAGLFAYYGALTWCRSFWPPSGYFRMVICIPPVVLAFVCLPIPQLPITRWVQRAGELTYSVYMLHFPLILTAVTIAMALGIHFDCRSRALFVAYIIVVFGCAAICYRYFERPAQRMLRSAMLPPRVNPMSASA